MQDPTNEQSSNSDPSQQIQIPASSIQVEPGMTDEDFEFSGMARVVNQDNDTVTLEIKNLDFGQTPSMDDAMDRAINAPDDKGSGEAPQSSEAY